MSVVPDKNKVALSLAEAHRLDFPAIRRIVRVVGVNESSVHEPVKLLEVNRETSPSGIVPITLGPYPPKYPYPSIIIEVTEEEYQRICSGDLELPDGWTRAETLYQAVA
ncbi:MAG: hypothetical protein ABR907_08585 [Terracidiphilus sp.]|jgi:hypothetical protein